MKKNAALLFFISIHLISLPVLAQYKWTSLFNGKNFKGWDIKITGSPVNVNYKNTFRIENRVMKVSYDEYDRFDDQYGHIYYKKPYSNYLLIVQYRFTGDQLKGGASWNVRNSGVMIHSQSAASMGPDQSFPVSLEVQFLGGLGKGPRATANLCTPGTTVIHADTTFLEHILESSSKTYDGDQWVTVGVMVLGDSVIRHYVNNEKVLTYAGPKIGGGFVHSGYTFTDAKVPDSLSWKKKEGNALSAGYVALQAESHPVEFRNVKLLDLSNIRQWQKLPLENILVEAMQKLQMD